MLILISCLLLFITALALIVLQVTQPNARYTWLIAVGGAILALISVFMWQAQMPLDFALPAWQPRSVFVNPIMFRAEKLSWPLALSIAAFTLTILLTAITHSTVTNSFTWAGTLTLGGIGLLAVTADNPLTLLLVWGALDITELITQLRSVDGPANSEKVVISFSTRALGIGLLLWANIVSIAEGKPFDFKSIASSAGLFLVAAAGLRLGVLPLHLPYSSESTLRRGIGTSLRLISAVSTIVLLTHVPAGSLSSAFTPFLMALVITAALYGGWMWLRAPDELTGRPYWIIILAALSVISALSGSPLGVVAWGCALILVGGALFLASVQQVWLNRAVLLGILGWDGARQVGAWLQATIVTLLTFGLVWATPRFRVLNPIRAHWVNSPATTGISTFYSGLWVVYRALGRISQAVNVTLEGESGIMWTLLFLVLFISLLVQRTP
jgi:hypothetical protein